MKRALLTARLVRAGRVRSCHIRPTSAGWKASACEDERLVQERTYSDWHRVEHTLERLEMRSLNCERRAGATPDVATARCCSDVVQTITRIHFQPERERWARHRIILERYWFVVASSASAWARWRVRARAPDHRFCPGWLVLAGTRCASPRSTDADEQALRAVQQVSRSQGPYASRAKAAALVGMWTSIGASGVLLRLGGASASIIVAIVLSGIAGTWMILVFRTHVTP